MAKIDLYDIDPVGSALFQDSENYLNELNEEEVDRLCSASEIVLTFTLSQDINIQTQKDKTYRTRSRLHSNKKNNKVCKLLQKLSIFIR
jgi:hypothetical protein